MEKYCMVVCFALFLPLVHSGENLSYGKPTKQSSIYKVKPEYDSGKAVDGCRDVKFAEGCCSSQDDTEGNLEVWWQVDLEELSVVSDIIIYYRLDHTSYTFPGVEIYLSNTDDWESGTRCYNHTQGQNLFYYQILTCEGVARYVTLLNDRHVPVPTGYSTVALLELCEVEVFGCYVGSFGTPCLNNCPADCLNAICHPDSGTCFSCLPGKYGLTCQTDCLFQCKDSVCDKHTGVCAECDTGKYGQKCTSCSTGCLNGTCTFDGNCHECKEGLYGVTCEDPCLSNCKDAICNRSTGLCDECNLDYYGNKCDTKCPYSCKDDVCNHDTGYCDVCESGKYGLMCENCSSSCLNTGCDFSTGACTSCPEGYYGMTCQLVCIGACNNNVCNRQSGYCDDCEPGKYGPSCYNCSDLCENRLCEQLSGLCFDCQPGRYGSGCNDSCFAACKGNKCNRTTGYCNECEPGKYGNNCTDCPSSCAGSGCDGVTGNCKNCSQNKYGDKCDQICPENCKGDNCERKCGMCYECDDGYFATRCDTQCPQECKDGVCNMTSGFCTDCQDGNYGPKCEYACAKECLNKVCDKTSGECNECSKGQFGKMCDKKCSDSCRDRICNQITGKCNECIPGRKGENCDHDCMKNCVTCDRYTGKCEVCSPGRYGSSCSSTCGHCYDGQCEIRSGACSGSKCKDGWEGTMCNRKESEDDDDDDDDDDGDDEEGGEVGVYVGVSIGTILFVVISVGLLIILCRFRKMGKENITDEQEEASIAIPLTPLNIPSLFPDVSTSSMVSDNLNYDSGEIPTTELRQVVIEKQRGKPNVLEKEFQSLPIGATFAWTVGAKPCFKEKNRYKSVYPYDHSRVVLDVIDKDPNTDYINASYIDSADKPKVYVAAQGPKANTVDDFWRMVWQLKSAKIVMVTNLVEGVKIKCEKYWPTKGDTLLTDQLELKMEKEVVYSFYTTRKIIAKKLKTTEEREIVQFHFTSWPDSGVPDTMHLVIFNQRIRSCEVKHNGPTIVHCSAGIGRTGTYIALDALYEYGKKNGRVDIFNYLKTLRKCRVAMVQTQEQYDIIHFALIEAFELPVTSIPKDKFREEYDRRMKSDGPKNQTSCCKEFQMLEAIQINRELLRRPSKEDERECIKHIIFSRSYIPGMPDELDAISLQTFTKSSGFIITRTPDTKSAEDFWHIVVDYNCTCIVHLSNTDNKIRRSLWLPQNKALEHEGIGITHTADLKHSASFSIAQYHVTYENMTSIDVKVFKVVNWPGEYSVPPSKSDVRQLLDALDQEKSSLPSDKILVTCSDGSSQAGLFCLLYNLKQQLQLDDEIDIYQAARQLKHRRKEFISRYEQYQFAYDVIMDYIDSK